MAKASTLQRFTSILVDQLGIDEGDVKLETKLVEDLVADSLDLVEIVMAAEEEFEVEIPDDAEVFGGAVNTSTVEQWVKLIDAKLAEKATVR